MNVRPIIGLNRVTIGGLDYERLMKIVTLYIMAALYVMAGTWHFVKPKMYLRIMPPYLPAPLFLVYLSGIIEIALGILLWVPATRALAAWGVIALLIAVFPANIYMLQKGGEAFRMSDWVLWVRLPIQLVLIAWAYCYT
jgi:uncharacterized membrane protein